ncbi:hypothetical protein IQ254_03960 [Nodosilinea sp. LEGE 07088]|uniref:hypothetical protein n=1 Tax=Nodosilinea sp. LEGE 07088 TaxID=2777968 RepID=UPI001880B146|nr:hypothetical protein [Nodosilinea sp. LEGE 07088]MBE9136363.1 hypothetical protein [Nodosilinea sp. LEGE 07088]
MAGTRRKQRLFSGMNYREVQRSNTNRRKKLHKADQAWLKDNGYKNIGWDNVIQLYQKINDILTSPKPDDPTLEDLFLKADQIGQKYQTPDEIKAFEQTLQVEVDAISEQIDNQFPDQDVEMIDYSAASRPRAKRNAAKSRKG